MKSILITAKNSYIGKQFGIYYSSLGNNVEYISLRDNAWKYYDFSKYDTILHVAGIAHTNKKNIDDFYYKINSGLSEEVANKAKKEGVNHFIFLSSIIIYGNQSKITKKTIPKPLNSYGESKLLAENYLIRMEDDKFKTAIIRLPMVYGKESKGNYKLLSKYANYLTIFPRVNNKKSVIYIENLNYFLKIVVDNSLKGIFFPQNKEYVSTVEFITEIRTAHNRKKPVLIEIGNSFQNYFNKIPIYKKLFSSNYYERDISNFEMEYNKFSFKESIKKIEEGNE